MATITPTILQNNLRKSGTWNVVYRLSHKRKSVYIKTSHEVTSKNLTKENTLKNNFVLQYLAGDIKIYKERMSRIGMRLESMSAGEIRDAITIDNEKIDFIRFGETYIAEVRSKLTASTANTYISLLNHLKDYQNDNALLVDDITLNYIKGFMQYLRSEKEISRPSRYGILTYQSALKSNNSVRAIIGKFETIYKACKSYYNNEDIGVIRIPNDPFARLELPRAVATRKRSLSVQDIRRIRDYDAETFSEKCGQHLFMLSFYLCGINGVDIFNSLELIKNGRLQYNRSKIKNKRLDNGLINIKIPDEAKQHIKFYFENNHKWTTPSIMNTAVNNGLAKIARRLRLPDRPTTYYARHSFATIARNDCRCRKEDVSMALNHIDNTTRMTDVYLAPDWSIIDDVQKAVIEKLNEE